MSAKRNLVVMLASVAVAVSMFSGGMQASARQASLVPVQTDLGTFAAQGSGSTVGPGGALYVTDGRAGRVLRVDPTTGAVSTFASGLPLSVAPIGGAMDVAFRGQTAYVLVTLVGPFFGQATVDGIYRIEKDGSHTVVADLGAWSTDHPPVTGFFIPSGVQYALQSFRDGFLVTDGHHNRVLWVTLKGDISELVALDNIVPTGLEVSGNTVYVGQAGPVPHLPATGKVLSFGANAPAVSEVASGASLIVDVEFGRGHQLYALSQGSWDPAIPAIPANAGAPAAHNTGALVLVKDGGLPPVVGGLDQPTSLEFIGDTAFVITLTGKVIRIDNV